MRNDKRNLTDVFDLFQRLDGSRIQTSEEWMEYREEWKQLLEEEIYGSFPKNPDKAKGIVRNSRLLYDGRMILEDIDLVFGQDEQIHIPAEILRPIQKGQYPVIIWNRHEKGDICPAEEELVCERGMILASFCRCDLAADTPGETLLDRAYAGYGWGRIAQWAFGMRKLLDYVEEQPYCNRDWIV